jgi:hypothetical protein
MLTQLAGKTEIVLGENDTWNIAHSALDVSQDISYMSGAAPG